MENDQEEFKGEIEETERTIANFSQYTNIKDHSTVSALATSIYDKLKEF